MKRDDIILKWERITWAIINPIAYKQLLQLLVSLLPKEDEAFIKTKWISDGQEFYIKLAPIPNTFLLMRGYDVIATFKRDGMPINDGAWDRTHLVFLAVQGLFPVR